MLFYFNIMLTEASCSGFYPNFGAPANCTTLHLSSFVCSIAFNSISVWRGAQLSNSLKQLSEASTALKQKQMTQRITIRRLLSEWVSEWVSEWRQPNNCSAISWREHVNFKWDDDKVGFVLDQHAELDCYSANSLKQQSVDRHVAPLGHIILIPRQPVFALSP
jgi:hypothetical protein